MVTISAFDQPVYNNLNFKSELTIEDVIPIFEQVKSAFFPRFPKGWTVLVTEETGPDYPWTEPWGCCDWKAKEIRIQPKAPYELREKIRRMREIIRGKGVYAEDIKTTLILMLIHEMCHAVAPGRGHIKKWQNRMRRAADKAVKMGYDEQDFDGIPHCLRFEADFYDVVMEMRYQENRKCSRCGRQWTAKTDNSRCPKCRSKESERLEA